MRRFQGYGPLIAASIVGLGLLVFAGPLSRWLAENRAAYNGTIVGHVVQAEGSTRRIHGATIDLIASPVSDPLELRDGDRLQTSVDSKAVVVLNSQDEFAIGQGSNVQFQLWNPKDAGSPIYVNPLLGKLTLKRAGIQGKAYVIKDGRLYLPGQNPTDKPLALTVLRNAPLDLHVLEADAKQSPPEQPDNAEPGPTEHGGEVAITPGATAPTAEPETLANEFIDSTIVARQSLLEKCWLTRLKDSPTLHGEIVVQFAISRRGQVKNVHIGDSTVADDTLKSCVTSVFERLTFRPFRGPEIVLSYPIRFQ